MSINNKNQILNKTITQTRFSSFYMELELICNFLCLFIELDNIQWFSITISDGVLSIKKCKEPRLITLDEIKDDFAYPIYEFDSTILNKIIKSINAFYYLNQEDECYSIAIELSDSKQIILLDKDDNLHFEIK